MTNDCTKIHTILVLGNGNSTCIHCGNKFVDYERYEDVLGELYAMEERL